MTSHIAERWLFAWLVLAGFFGTLIGVPFSIAVLQDPAAGGPVDPQTIWLRAVGEALFLLAPASAVGVWLGKRVGVGAMLPTHPTGTLGFWRRVRPALAPALAIGLALAAPGLIGAAFIPQGEFGPGLGNPTPVEWLLRALSAALTEEIGFRLGLMTLFVWMIRWLASDKVLESPAIWTGNVLAALAGAGAHLPPLLSLDAPNWGLVTMVVSFSSVAGIILGWLYARYGLMSAMLAHLLADLVQHVIPRAV